MANKMKIDLYLLLIKNSLLFTQLCVPLLTTLCKQQQLPFFLLLCLRPLHKQ